MADTSETYVKITDTSGETYYCPAEALQKGATYAGALDGECVDASIVGRYAGSIKVVSD